MKPDKTTIKRSFSRAADTYDSSSAFQREVAEDLGRCIGALLYGGRPEYPVYERAGLERMLVEVSLSANAGKVLDIGCGTGHLTAELKKVSPGSGVYATDIARPMLLKAREKDRDLVVTGSDFESLPFAPSSFGIVASSLTYQWASDLTAAFSEAARVLSPGGLFVFTTLGPATLNELKASYREACGSSVGPALMEFKGTDEISGALSEAGLNLISLESLPVFKRYPDLKALLRTLKGIGASPPSSLRKGLSTGALIKEAERVYSKRFPAPGGGGVVATYEVIFAAARKGL